MSAKSTAEILAQVGAISKLAAVVPASRLDARVEPEMVSSGIPQLDLLTGGFARGCLTEICGGASSGRTGVLFLRSPAPPSAEKFARWWMQTIPWIQRPRGRPAWRSAVWLWVRCGEKHRMQQASGGDQSRLKWRAIFADSGSPALGITGLGQMLKVTDLLLQSNEFGMIALDLGDVPAPSARRIPLASWFRFRRRLSSTRRPFWF